MGDIIMDERLQDALIDTAVNAYLEETGREALDDIKDTPLMAVPGEVWRALRRERRRASMQHRRRRWAAAAAALLLTVGFAVSFGTVDAFRLGVIRFFQEVQNDVNKTVTQGQGAAPAGEDIHLPEYIPEGFVCVDNDTQGGKTRIRYMRGDESIFYMQTDLANTSINAVIGDAEVNASINGLPAVVTAIESGDISVVWYTESQYFALLSNLSRSEVIKIAESVYQN